MNLDKLLNPRKMAIVGASEKENLGGFSVRMVMEHAKDRMDDIYFINPNRESIFGVKCYRSLSDLPENIDMVIIATPKKTVEPIIKEARSVGARGAVVFASGYGEAGDTEAEESLKRLCYDLDVALMGPNCAGYMNLTQNMIAMGFITTVPEKKGRVGLISQSGMICTLLLDSGKADFSHVISCGNSKIVEVVDYMDYLVEDENTDVIAAYIEGVADAGKFINVLKKASEKQKPVILLKIGSSEEGSLSAASHTGSMSGSDKSFDAVFDKFGVIRVDDLEDLASMSNMLSTIKALPKSDRVISVNGSGGETGVSCDVGGIYDLNYVAFADSTRKKLVETLPSYAVINNPLDTTATVCYDTDEFANIMNIIESDENCDMIMVGISIVDELTDLCVKHMSEGIAQFTKSKPDHKPIVVVSAIESGRMQEYVNILKDAGVPVLPSPTYGYKHVKKFIDYAEYVRTIDSRTLQMAIPSSTIESKKIALSENESKKLLGTYGIPVPKEFIAATQKQSVEYARELGYPVVMKVESNDILHKSDAGGVMLGINSDEEVVRAHKQILENAKNYDPSARINGVLVQKMLKQGMEVIVGVNNDPLFGPMVLFGLGGVFVEIFEDVSLYPAPFNKEEAYKMINSLKSSRMFYGYRGSKELDVDVLADILVKVSDFAVANKDNLDELDINPLFVYEKGQGAYAADGLVVLKN